MNMAMPAIQRICAPRSSDGMRVTVYTSESKISKPNSRSRNAADRRRRSSPSSEPSTTPSATPNQRDDAALDEEYRHDPARRSAERAQDRDIGALVGDHHHQHGHEVERRHRDDQHQDQRHHGLLDADGAEVVGVIQGPVADLAGPRGSVAPAPPSSARGQRIAEVHVQRHARIRIRQQRAHIVDVRRSAIRCRSPARAASNTPATVNSRSCGSGAPLASVVGISTVIGSPRPQPEHLRDGRARRSRDRCPAVRSESLPSTMDLAMRATSASWLRIDAAQTHRQHVGLAHRQRLSSMKGATPATFGACAHVRGQRLQSRAAARLRRHENARVRARATAADRAARLPARSSPRE